MNGEWKAPRASKDLLKIVFQKKRKKKKKYNKSKRKTATKKETQIFQIYANITERIMKGKFE